ncbi:hypothetical protein ACHAW6_000766 [Cyclotella cf. meneghiniana]
MGGAFRTQANSVIDNGLSKKMVTYYHNLANAAIQKNDTIKTLVNTNKQLTKTVHNLQEQNAKFLQILEKHAGAMACKTVGKVYAATESSYVWDPSGYCWTHGFKVKKGHTSKSCKTQAEGHQEGATHHNTMGGSQANIKWKPKD